MSKLEISGGKKLSGKIKVAGNKNSVLPIMAASLLSTETSTIENAPQISDVDVMADLLKLCGAKVTRANTKITINPKKIKEVEFPRSLTAKLRASVVLLAPILSRVGKISMGYPGGDIIGRRSLDAHLQVLKKLGAKIEIENDHILASVSGLKGAEIFLQEASVTATENALMAASLAEGETIIKRAAIEPHVIDLCLFLVKMGADIEGIGTSTVAIRGVSKLFGANHVVRPDHIEVGTFAILAAIASKKIEISPIIKEDLDMILLSLNNFGVRYKLERNKLIVNGSKLKSVEKVVTDVWPGFPTDLMAPMIVLATQAEGMTILHDWMYESRMFFVDKLLSMNAKVEIADPHRVFVYGPTKLRGQRLDTPDIRAGIALVIAALVAKGKSTIERAELIERGYENIVERLSALGARIKKTS
ncbi:UDP-N-acetylglucosamine 1-carboxyvinyltransferase [Candidatus Curtissbacteria bacterium RIFCSPLOWO2_02_FULL_40_11]|uniref:UDP-N-acetylglucosamine 1-carboxyvinyltransferase n=2 Tax=Candidatus Curtissiibacteriota TaxID=1752717 RepID=A0A1F5G9T0_9BACT|nr:MAG: UDP-N-acetylglucosamine 1-carboxyvinyltransferase [Candidatus Curtissbacteria bacterium RIFCSPHIGHO2_02_FULL_40_16b]OGE01526.1 MAG: UDP-N-acetylglucosamine 1-carboxyvinyltransferase [Candidatus Curtissbacteria bacterium RIFCSPLOWO2_02_FULL_40_11]OGE13860.1 MAG: UDP-N-acetylglucosamine 1-carboxyvinyltransferase [Candidatus Curtissbacteria bacterium RIFCSPLOWO2_12_FULL_38_9]